MEVRWRRVCALTCPGMPVLAEWGWPTLAPARRWQRAGPTGILGK